MSLRFYFGPSGAGKSRQLYEEIISRSLANPRQNFLIIVPDQFTMQTQKDLVMLHERGGIMNIDVLSFGRLNHRIMEEVGTRNIPVLDDTGKSLILQKVAGQLKGSLPALGSFLQKQGYIHEVKSAISEFMQYGIGPEDVDKLIAFSEKRGALVQKLKDLKVLYKGFLEYIQDNFITTEETLDRLRLALHKSGLLPGSVVVFDGFTGFTPIQNRLIQELMCICGEVVVTLTLGEGENPWQQDGEQKLFHLSKKTAADLEKLAKAAGVPREKDVFIPFQEGRHRFRDSEALGALERGLFRYTNEPYEKPQSDITLFETVTCRDEVHQAGLFICRLIQEKGLAYRDIAVITGDLDGYAPYVESEFEQFGIPCFIDRTRGIVLNPMVEYIKSALELFLQDFSYEAVFHYLRSGMTGIAREDIDALENYVLRTGIRGYRSWSRLFTAKTGTVHGKMSEEQAQKQEEVLQRLNGVREQFMAQIAMLKGAGKAPAGDYINQLYDFVTENKVQQKLADYENAFRQRGDASREREYAQIYRLVMELFNQIYELLGEETITLQEFADILEAGFGEIQVGSIPQNVDRVLVGDMERTRLKQVKALFFLGLNDGNIPKNVSRGGIISDMDREFLRESELELAPSPRQQMYIQRFYLYLNLTKPSGYLYLSYARINGQGKSLRPAYLVDMIRKLFPGLQVSYPQMKSLTEQIVTPREGLRYLAQTLREYAAGNLSREEQPLTFTLYQAYGEETLGDIRGKLEQAAFRRYRDSGLSRAVARALYGKELENSVTRLETYAACAYRHFLQYGLTLREREEFGFETVDLGNVYHGVLELFAGKLTEAGYTWFTFPEEFGERAVREALEEYAAVYGETVLYSSARNEYALTRMARILTRTVIALQSQLKKGVFQPREYELSFRFANELEHVNVALSREEKMYLRGRIDRMDVAEDAEHVYVKVIDYKSGSRQFQLAALYYGLQLQLAVYMNVAMELEARRHPDKEIVPAAMLYYHVDDPVVESAAELDDEEINQQILEKLRMSGVVNGEPDIVEKLDGSMEQRSSVIPVEKKKDGSFTSRSGVLSREELKTVSDYVNVKIRQIGREILDGDIQVNPYEKGSEEACTYCAYQKVCGFDSAIPGYGKRQLPELEKEEVLRRMKEANGD